MNVKAAILWTPFNTSAGTAEVRIPSHNSISTWQEWREEKKITPGVQSDGKSPFLGKTLRECIKEKNNGCWEHILDCGQYTAGIILSAMGTEGWGGINKRHKQKKRENEMWNAENCQATSICLYSHSISWMLLSVLIISLLRSLASVLTSAWRWHHLCSSVCKCVCVCVCICHLWKKLLALTPSALVNHLSSPLSLLSLLPPSTENMSSILCLLWLLVYVPCMYPGSCSRAVATGPVHSCHFNSKRLWPGLEKT